MEQISFTVPTEGQGNPKGNLCDHTFVFFWVLCAHIYVPVKRQKLLFPSRWESVNESHSIVSNSLQPHRVYCPWKSPGQNIGVGSHSLLQRIFPTQGSKSGLLHCRQTLPAEPPGVSKMALYRCPSTCIFDTRRCFFFFFQTKDGAVILPISIKIDQVTLLASRVVSHCSSECRGFTEGLLQEKKGKRKSGAWHISPTSTAKASASSV